MIRLVTLCTACLLLAMTVFAQGRVVKVNVISEDNKASKEVGDVFRGKIGSTLRYSLVEASSATIAIDVLCLPAEGQNVACTAIIVYFPEASKGLSNVLTPMIVLGGTDYVAQSLFDDFVSVSSDQQLSGAEAMITTATNKFWTDGYNHGYRAAQGAAKTSSDLTPKKN